MYHGAFKVLVSRIGTHAASPSPYLPATRWLVRVLADLYRPAACSDSLRFLQQETIKGLPQPAAKVKQVADSWGRRWEMLQRASGKVPAMQHVHVACCRDAASLVAERRVAHPVQVMTGLLVMSERLLSPDGPVEVMVQLQIYHSKEGYVQLNGGAECRQVHVSV